MCSELGSKEDTLKRRDINPSAASEVAAEKAPPALEVIFEIKLLKSEVTLLVTLPMSAMVVEVYSRVTTMGEIEKRIVFA